MNLKETTSNKYAKAFIRVAQMLEPNTDFTRLILESNVTEYGCENDIKVIGTLDDALKVVVTTELSGADGMQVVVKYYQLDNDRLVYTRKIWYFTFNWKGLMATE